MAVIADIDDLETMQSKYVPHTIQKHEVEFLILTLWSGE
jgi:hypothetical protein